MFEQTQPNRFQITRNDKEKENSQNKLMSYFQNSSFLAQQEELSMFIKSMPVIRIQEIHSINKLIEVLIRQNEALGGKCQQNILTVKEMFSKHQELMRINRQLQAQLERAEQVMQYNSLNQKQFDSYEGQLAKIKKQLTEKDQTVGKLSEMTEQLRQQNKQVLQNLQQVAQVVRLVGQRNFKRCGQKIKQLTNNEKTHWQWLDFSGLQKLIKEEKKRSKYTPKIRQTVELFCSRFMKISQYVPAQIIKEEFNKEVSNLLEILDDLLLLKKKNNNSTSQSRLTVDFNTDSNFFEGLLDKILKQRESNNVSREEIAGELISVRQELEECKRYYEQYLISTKMEYEQSSRRTQEELTEKTQILQYYEQQKETTTKEMLILRQKIQQLEKNIITEREEGLKKSEQFNSLEAKIEQMRSQGLLKENQLRLQWEQNVKTYQYKLSQKQELIEEEQKLRKSIKNQLQDERGQLKAKLLASTDRETGLMALNKELEEKIQDLMATLGKTKNKNQEEVAKIQQQVLEKNQKLEQLIRKREKQAILIKKLKEELEESQKEKALQTDYIKQIEQKNKDLNGKLKSVQNRKYDEKTAKKEMDSFKKTMLEQKKYYRSVEESLQDQKDENQRQKEENQKLKSLVKEMKKELQEVYHQFGQLKTIQSDREKLIIQMQRSDRAREELIRALQTQKTEIIRLQQDNKSLILQAKHYKSALNRIDALRI